MTTADSWVDYGGFLERAARLFARRTAIACGDRELTYAELYRWASRMAAGLTELGLVRGDRVVDVRSNSVESLLVDYAVALAGLVRVPINSRSSVPEFRALVSNVGARAVLTAPEHAKLVEGLREHVPSVKFVVADSIGGVCGIEGVVPLSSLDAQPLRNRRHAAPDELLALRFSGGTTGLPKAALYTHGAQIQASMCYLMSLADLQDDDLVLLTQPFSHGSSQWVLPCAMTGAGIVMQRRFDVDDVLDEIEARGVTVLKIVPTMLLRLVRAQRARPRNLDTLRLLSYGAAPMPEELLLEAMALFGCGFSQVYGTAEGSAAVCALTVRDHERARRERGTLLRSVGRPYPIVDVVVLDDAGAAVEPGVIGEVTVRSSMIMPGYWGDPEQSAAKLREGRVHTGDLGYLSDDGYLYLVGRKDDVVISGGYNVYPGEVEAAMRSLPGVRDVAVTAVTDDEWGDRVVAAVVLDEGACATPEELIAGTRGLLAGYKTPKAVRVLPAMPLTLNGKPDRARVRAAFGPSRSGSGPPPWTGTRSGGGS
jgi:fatty-acyl-CoA synthase